MHLVGNRRFKVVQAETFTLKLDSNKMSSAIVSRELHGYSCFLATQRAFWNEVPYRGLGAEKLSAGG